MNEKYCFSIDKYELMDFDDLFFAKMRLYVCSDGDNHHGLPMEAEVIKKASSSLIKKPVVYKYSPINKDFEEHEKSEIPCGYFSESDNNIHLEEIEGKIWLVADAIIWKYYAKEVMEVFLEDNNRSVSMEIAILNKTPIGNGKYQVNDFVFVGVTLLGKKYPPAIDGANAKIIKFSEKDYFNKIKETEVYFSKINKDSTLTNFPNEGDNKEILLSNSKYKLANYSFVKKIKEQYPETWGKIGDNDSISWNTDEALNVYDNIRKGNIGDNEKEWIIKREKFFDKFYNNLNNFEEVLSALKWIGYSAVGKTQSYKIIKEELNKMDSKLEKQDMSVGETLGKSSSITISNNKSNAVMSGSWSGQDAGFLNKLLNASNHKSLVEEAYLIHRKDTSGDLSVNDIGYEHHVLKGDTLVVSKPGVDAASSRLNQMKSQNKISDSDYSQALRHINKHRKELGEDALEKFSEGGKNMDKQSIEKMCNTMKGYSFVNPKFSVDMPKYSLYKMDETYAYALDNEDEKVVKVPYSLGENEDYILNVDAKEDISEEDLEVTTLKMLMNEMCNVMAKMSTDKNQLEKEVESKKDNIIKMGAEIDSIKAEMSNMKKEIETKDAEISKYALNEKKENANKIIEKYSTKLSEEEKNDFISKVANFSKIEDFEKDLKAFVCDKFENELKDRQVNSVVNFMATNNVNITDNKNLNLENWQSYISEYLNNK